MQFNKRPRKPLTLLGVLGIAIALALIKPVMIAFPIVWKQIAPRPPAQLKTSLSATGIQVELAEPEPQFKSKMLFYPDWGQIDRDFRLKKTELYKAGDDRIVGYSMNQFLWEERYEQFQAAKASNPDLTYPDFLWQEAQRIAARANVEPNSNLGDMMLIPNREKFDRVTSFAETYEEYLYETDAATRAKVDAEAQSGQQI